MRKYVVEVVGSTRVYLIDAEDILEALEVFSKEMFSVKKVTGLSIKEVSDTLVRNETATVV